MITSLTQADFIRISKETIDPALRLKFLRKKGVPGDVAQLILKERPRRHEDLLRIPGLIRKEPRLLRRLIEAPALGSLSRASRSGELKEFKTGRQAAGIVGELRTLSMPDGKTLEIALRDAVGEIAAVQLDPDDSFQWHTIRFLDVPIPYLWTLSQNQKGLLHTRLQVIPRSALETFLSGPSTSPNDPIDSRLRGLAGIVIALQNFTASNADRKLVTLGFDPLAGSRNPDPGILVDGNPDDIEMTDDDRERDCTSFNGCGPEFSKDLADRIPEFTFGECCNAHDIAYCKGCSECDRVKADSDFLECMLASSSTAKGDALAFIYYLAVRAIGVVAFNHCFDRNGITGLVSAVAGVIAGVGMGALALGLGLAGLGAAGVGVVGAGAITWVLSYLLCVPCELVDRRLESAIEEVEEFERRVRQEVRRRRRGCRRRRGFLAKIRCLTKLLLLIILWILVVICFVVVKIGFNLIRILLCGGLNRT